MPPSPSKLGRQLCWVACLLVRVSGLSSKKRKGRGQGKCLSSLKLPKCQFMYTTSANVNWERGRENGAIECYCAHVAVGTRESTRSCLPFVFVAHDSVLCSFNNTSASDRGKWCGLSGHGPSITYKITPCCRWVTLLQPAPWRAVVLGHPSSFRPHWWGHILL